MYPRVEYEMSEEDCKTLLEACRPTPVILIGGYAGSDPQQNANAAWSSLGTKMGFDWETVQPIQGKGMRFFSAVPIGTRETQAEMNEREKREEREIEIIEHREQIKIHQDALAKLEATE